jgi:hypothetical protein
MRLIANWRQVLVRAWSIKFMLIAGVFSGLEFALPYLEPVFPLDPGVFALLAFFATAGGLISRLIAQRNTQEGVMPDAHEEGGV